MVSNLNIIYKISSDVERTIIDEQIQYSGYSDFFFDIKRQLWEDVNENRRRSPVQSN